MKTRFLLLTVIIFLTPTVVQAGNITANGSAAASGPAEIIVKEDGEEVFRQEVYKRWIGTRVSRKVIDEKLYIAVVPRKQTVRRGTLRVYRVDTVNERLVLVAKQRVRTNTRRFFPRWEDRDLDGQYEVTLYKKKKKGYHSAFTFVPEKKRLKRYRNPFDESDIQIVFETTQAPDAYCTSGRIENNSSTVTIPKWKLITRFQNPKRVENGIYKKKKQTFIPYEGIRTIKPGHNVPFFVCGADQFTLRNSINVLIAKEKLNVAVYHFDASTRTNGFSIPEYAQEYNFWVQANNYAKKERSFKVAALLVYGNQKTDESFLFHHFAKSTVGKKPGQWSRERAPLETTCSTATPCFFDRNLIMTPQGIDIPIAHGEYSAIFSCNIKQPCERLIQPSDGVIHGAALVWAEPGVNVRPGIDIFDSRVNPTQYYDEFTAWSNPQGGWRLIQW